MSTRCARRAVGAERRRFGASRVESGRLRRRPPRRWPAMSSASSTSSSPTSERPPVTDAELDRLAELIARALLERGNGPPAERVARPRGCRRRCGPRRRSEVVPAGLVRCRAGPGRRRPALASTTSVAAVPRPPAELTRVTRAAAAGKGRRRSERPCPERRLTRHAAAEAPAIDVRIGVSNRHVHLSQADVQTLFGGAPLPSRAS